MNNLFAAYTQNHLGKGKITPATQEEVNAELQHLLEHHVHSHTKEGEAKEGDIVNIDYEGFLEGTPFDGGKGEHYDLKLGSHTFIPGFEEQLIGKKAGEEVDVNVSFPKEYHASHLAGKAVVFHCKVHEVKEEVRMELNDAFATHLGLSSVEELKTKMEEQINHHKQNDIDKEYLDKLIAQIVSASTIEVSPEEIERSRQRTLNFYTNSVAQYGMTLDAYIQAIGMSKEQFDAAIAKEAIQGAKTSALTQYIANRENLIPSEAEINKAISDIRNHYKLSDEQVNEFIRNHREDLIQDLSAEKVANFLLENND